jgi:hypothetical protein
LEPESYRGYTFIVDEYTSIYYTLTYTAGVNGSIVGEAEQTVLHGRSGTAVEAVPDEGYHFVQWSDGSTANPRVDTNVTADINVTAEFAINEYTVTFKDHDGTVLKTETVMHGGSATPPDDPEREGYTFIGWDADYSNVTGDLTVTAQYEYNGLAVLNEMIGEPSDRTRPAYTATIAEWDAYWGDFEAALAQASQVYDNLKDKSTLTEAEKSQIDEARANLQRQVEILNGIEDFDAALGDREEPLGLVETVYERSLQTGSFQPHRLRCYYDKEKSDFYWLLSGYLQSVCCKLDLPGIAE